MTGHKAVSTIVIDSRKANTTKLAALEKMMYGDAAADPELPEPDALIAMMAAS